MSERRYEQNGNPKCNLEQVKTENRISFVWQLTVEYKHKKNSELKRSS